MADIRGKETGEGVSESTFESSINSDFNELRINGDEVQQTKISYSPMSGMPNISNMSPVVHQAGYAPTAVYPMQLGAEHATYSALQHQYPGYYYAMQPHSIYEGQNPIENQHGSFYHAFRANLAITSLMSLYQHNLQSSQQRVQPTYLAPGNPGPFIQFGKKISGPPNCNLFIFHLPNECTNQHLFDMFRPYGKIISVRIMIDNATGRSRGFGFVSFEKESSASLAIKQMNGMSLGGKVLKVQLKSQNQKRKNGRTKSKKKRQRDKKSTKKSESVANKCVSKKISREIEDEVTPVKGARLGSKAVQLEDTKV
eukprot:g5162.t1